MDATRATPRGQYAAAREERATRRPPPPRLPSGRRTLESRNGSLVVRRACREEARERERHPVEKDDDGEGAGEKSAALPITRFA